MSKQHTRIIRHYYENKQLKYEISLLNNQLHGIGKQWYPDGRLELEVYWLYGKEVIKGKV